MDATPDVKKNRARRRQSRKVQGMAKQHGDRISMTDEGDLVFGVCEADADFDPALEVDLVGALPHYVESAGGDPAHADLVLAPDERFLVSIAVHREDAFEVQEDGEWRVVRLTPGLFDAAISITAGCEEDRQALGEALMRLGAMVLGGRPQSEHALAGAPPIVITRGDERDDQSA